MTVLEIIFIMVIWISYGVYVANKDCVLPIIDHDDVFALTLYITFAPGLLIYRMVRGIFV